MSAGRPASHTHPPTVGEVDGALLGQRQRVPGFDPLEQTAFDLGVAFQVDVEPGGVGVVERAERVLRALAREARCSAWGKMWRDDLAWFWQHSAQLALPRPADAPLEWLAWIAGVRPSRVAGAAPVRAGMSSLRGRSMPSATAMVDSRRSEFSRSWMSSFFSSSISTATG